MPLMRTCTSPRLAGRGDGVRHLVDTDAGQGKFRKQAVAARRSRFLCLRGIDGTAIHLVHYPFPTHDHFVKGNNLSFILSVRRQQDGRQKQQPCDTFHVPDIFEFGANVKTSQGNAGNLTPTFP